MAATLFGFHLQHAVFKNQIVFGIALCLPGQNPFHQVSVRQILSSNFGPSKFSFSVCTQSPSTGGLLPTQAAGGREHRGLRAMKRARSSLRRTESAEVFNDYQVAAFGALSEKLHRRNTRRIERENRARRRFRRILD